MDTAAISPIANTPTPAAQSTYLIDTYGIPAAGLAITPPIVVAQPPAPLVPPVDPVPGIRGSLIDTYA